MKHFFSSSRTTGFTLVELVVVMAIMALLMAITVPNFRGAAHSRQLFDATKTLQGEFRRSYTLARSEGADIVFQVTQTPDGLALYRCLATPIGTCDPSNREALLVGNDVFGEAYFVDGDASKEWLFTAPHGDIASTGSFPETTSVTLTHKKSGDEKKITVYDLSGLITLE